MAGGLIPPAISLFLNITNMLVAPRWNFSYKGVQYHAGDMLCIEDSEYETLKGDVLIFVPEQKVFGYLESKEVLDGKKVKRASNKKVKKAKNK